MEQAASVLCGMAELDIQSAELITSSVETLELITSYLTSGNTTQKKSAVKMVAFTCKLG
jgi:hypothetical protein